MAVSYLVLSLLTAFSAYRNLNRIAFSEPESKMDTVQLARNLNYLAEYHYVPTEDGYILQVDRIRQNVKTKGTILIVHGMLSSSSDFALNLANQSLAYLFANTGMDVWLVNLRGTTYSRRHKTLSPDDEKFWKFSFDENAAFDVPSVLDYLFNEQGVKKLHLLGHSMGSTTCFAMLSEIDRFNTKIIRFTAIAPLVEMEHVTTPFKFLAPYTRILKSVLGKLLGPELLPNNKVMKLIARTVCKTPLCFAVVGYLWGYPSQTNYSRSEIVFSHAPAGSSLQALDHLGQFIHKNEFRHYDYGKDQNQVKYGQIIPPMYNVTKIKVPVAILYCQNDKFVNPIDIKILKEKLTNCIEAIKVGDSKFSHTDFVFGIFSYRDLNKVLIKKIANNV